MKIQITFQEKVAGFPVSFEDGSSFDVGFEDGFPPQPGHLPTVEVMK